VTFDFGFIAFFLAFFLASESLLLLVPFFFIDLRVDPACLSLNRFKKRGAISTDPQRRNANSQLPLLFLPLSPREGKAGEGLSALV